MSELEATPTWGQQPSTLILVFLSGFLNQKKSSHICQHDPNTDESRADTGALTNRKVTLGGQKESVRGKMERKRQPWQREQCGDFYRHD